MDIDFDATTALLVVDVQNDFAHPEGNLFVQGGDAIIPTINDLVRDAEEVDALVVFTQDWHPEDTPHFEKDGGDWPVHCVQGTWGARFHPDLHVPVEAETIPKGTGGEDGYSGFTVRDPESGEEAATDLHALLQDHDIERVVVVGLAQDVCVHATVLDACEKGYDTVVLSDATRPVEMEPGDGEQALEGMREAGADVR